jgi:hypothetical protein
MDLDTGYVMSDFRNQRRISGAITKAYKSKFAELLKPYGFKSSKSTFYRVINDVLQAIQLMKTSISCSIGFDIIPLSLGISHLDWGRYCITDLREGKMKSHLWLFEPSSLISQNAEGETIVNKGQSMEDILESMALIITTEVLPIFEKGTTSKTAYDELIKYEKRINADNKDLTEFMKHLRIDGVGMNNGSLLFMCIKAQNYEKAFQHMEAIVKQGLGLEFFTLYEKIASLFGSAKEDSAAEAELNSLIEQLQPQLKPRTQKSFERLRKLSIPDTEYFQKLIAENEEASARFLQGLNKSN